MTEHTIAELVRRLDDPTDREPPWTPSTPS